MFTWLKLKCLLTHLCLSSGQHYNARWQWHSDGAHISGICGPWWIQGILLRQRQHAQRMCRNGHYIILPYASQYPRYHRCWFNIPQGECWYSVILSKINIYVTRFMYRYQMKQLKAFVTTITLTNCICRYTFNKLVFSSPPNINYYSEMSPFVNSRLKKSPRRNPFQRLIASGNTTLKWLANTIDATQQWDQREIWLRPSSPSGRCVDLITIVHFFLKGIYWGHLAHTITC